MPNRASQLAIAYWSWPFPGIKHLRAISAREPSLWGASATSERRGSSSPGSFPNALRLKGWNFGDTQSTDHTEILIKLIHGSDESLGFHQCVS